MAFVRLHLLYKALARISDKFEHFADFGRVRPFLLNTRDRLCSVQTGASQDAERVLERLNGFGGVSAPLQTYAISAIYLHFAGCGNGRKRQHVLSDHRVAADHRMTPDAAKLMNAAVAADIGVFIHSTWPAKVTEFASMV